MAKLEIGKRYLLRAHPGEAEIGDAIITELSPSGKFARVMYGSWLSVDDAVVLEVLPPKAGPKAEPVTSDSAAGEGGPIQEAPKAAKPPEGE